MTNSLRLDDLVDITYLRYCLKVKDQHLFRYLTCRVQFSCFKKINFLKKGLKIEVTYSNI